MSPENRLLRRVRLLAMVVAGLAVAAPLSAQSQIVLRGQRRDTTRRDSAFTMRLLRSSEQDSVVVRLDSIWRVLDHLPLGSSDRAQVEASFQAVIGKLSSLAGQSAAIGVQIGKNLGRDFPTMMERVLIERGVAGGQGSLRWMTMPRGWIGFIAEGPQVRRVTDGEEVIRYFAYPAIVSVDPNSPADRAGIAPGDTLIAYDRSDVRDHDINVTRLLVPDRRVAVTVRRDGSVMDFTIPVAKAPEDFARTRWEINAMVLDSVGADGRQFVHLPGSGNAVFGTVRSRSPAPVGDPARFERSVPRPVFGGPTFPRMAEASGQIWGAQLATIDVGLAKTVGVKTGVLVTAVVPATPAAKSGLKSGDIIVRIDGRPLMSLEQLRRATIEHLGDHAIELQVQREKKLRKLTLSWAR